PPLRFKRRKIAHAKRHPGPSTSEASDAADVADPTDGLKDALRNRKRPRAREAERRLETASSQALVPAETPKRSSYESRFVAQTGEVIDADDQQMTNYIEARLAEKNHRLYGWPVPKHLETAVATLAPELESTAYDAPADRMTISDSQTAQHKSGAVGADQIQRLAAGMGKLEEVDLDSNTASHSTVRTPKVRLGRDGKPRRPPKRRNSEDLRRDQMVEAVLREAKLDYFEETTAGPSTTSDANNDDAMAEQFRREFLESMEAARQQRKPATTTGAKDAKEAPRGPKLGGSRNARAAMRLQQEQAAKSK
ncbi:hypothetical protein P280DRAFT_381672, partial [Massarina eburnea CBS 473.64]